MTLKNDELLVLVILLCYAVPVILAINMRRKCAEVYANLPEKIPIHFGIAGTADGWAEKSRFSVFWIVWFTLGMDAFLFATLFYVPMRKDPWYEVMLAGGFMNASIGYMFYRINDGVLDVALGKASNIWPYLKAPLALVILSSLFMTSPVFIQRKPVLVSHVLCETVDREGEPVSEREYFTSRDRCATIFLKWEFLDGNHVVRYEWYDPSGNLIFKHEHRPEKRHKMKHRRTWCYINIAGTPSAQKKGKWKVAVYLDDKRKIERSFFLK